MSLKPWREIARPHKDVLQGTFKQSEFAADISQVASGTATEEYQNAESFFARTFITEGMRLLLISVAQRLAGKGGDPVIQLQTAFGGGKTHTMLAVLHLALRKVSTNKLEGIPPLLDEAGIVDLPHAKVAVLDGIKLAPNQPQVHGDVKANTLWGELAWQLLSHEGYAMVAQSDLSGTSPGKEVLQQLLTAAAPCVILIDELVAFIRQFELGKAYTAGTFDSNITFIQTLTEALKAVPNAILLASLPESEIEVGGTMGQRALESLEKYFARVESVWKPVASTEAFEIVRRRLFDFPGEKAEVEGISRQFHDFYRANSEKFPLETQSNVYFERLCQSYPIHPEIFDRLYEDWSTLDKFQRTRGVLQYMAIVIHRLWNSENKDALILPGSVDLSDTNVRNKSIHYLPQGWEPVIEREVDGIRSEPYDIDSKDTRFGSVQAARRTMRTLFLGSAPATNQQTIKGLNQEHILLGCVQPGQTIGVFEDVLKRLRDKLHYLYAETDRFYLDTRPNLRREMESRKQNIDDRQTLIPYLKSSINQIFASRHCFGGIHIFTDSNDIPDDYATGPRLVVLPINAAYSRTETSAVFAAAENILTKRGDQPRHKQNRLIFFAADFDTVSRLKDAARVFLAWQSIVQDVNDGKLDINVSLANQAKKNKETAQGHVQHMIRQAYKWIIVPTQEVSNNKTELHWEAISISPSAQNILAEIENKLKEEEWLINQWSPVHLLNELKKWYFKNDVTEVSALKVWQDTCHYLYLPRLVNDKVFINTVTDGLSSEDYFGFATGKDGEQYLGFSFGRNAMLMLDDSSLLIEKHAAADYRERTKPKPVEPASVVQSPAQPSAEAVKTQPQESHINPTESDSAQIHKEIMKRFYSTVSLDPITAKMQFSTIVDEVIEQFTAKTGVNVNISIEITADCKNGFDENIQRSVKENCNVLKFDSSEFDI